MPNNHISPTGNGPLIAHDRMVTDATRKAVAWIKKEKRKGKNSANASVYPETTVLALPDGRLRRIHTLPPGFHVPRRETAEGIVVYGCAASEAVAGTAPLRGAEKQKSNRPLALAPQQVLKWLVIPATSSGDTIPPDVATDAKSAPGCSTSSDDGNRIQRSPNEPSEASDATQAIDTAVTSPTAPGAAPERALRDRAKRLGFRLRRRG